MRMPDRTPPRWISFDCYGTLIDWEQGVLRACRELAPLSEDDAAGLFRAWERTQWEMLQGPYLPYAEILRASFRQTMEELGYRLGSYAADAFVDSLARWEPFPDVKPALVRLSNRFRLAIISNIDRQLLGGSLRRLAVRFDALVTAEDARAYKPDPEIFRHALRQLGCGPEQIAHVAFGAEYDLGPASALGFRAVYLNRRGAARLETPVEAEIRTLEELPGLWEAPEKAAAARRPQSSARIVGRRGAEV